MSAEKKAYYPESVTIEEPIIPSQDNSRIIERPEQDAKLLSARDINSKMGDFEIHFETLTKDFSEALDDLGSTIRSLRSRNAKLDKKIESVGSNLSQSTLEQVKLPDALEQRIQPKLNTQTGC